MDHTEKNLPAMRETGSISGSGRSPGEGNGYLLKYSCLENPIDRGAWWATQSMGSREADTTERLTLSLLSMCIKRLINEQYALFFLFCLSFLEGTLLI